MAVTVNRETYRYPPMIPLVVPDLKIERYHFHEAEQGDREVVSTMLHELNPKTQFIGISAGECENIYCEQGLKTKWIRRPSTLIVSIVNDPEKKVYHLEFFTTVLLLKHEMIAPNPFQPITVEFKEILCRIRKQIIMAPSDEALLNFWSYWFISEAGRTYWAFYMTLGYNTTKANHWLRGKLKERIEHERRAD